MTSSAPAGEPAAIDDYEAARLLDDFDIAARLDVKRIALGQHMHVLTQASLRYRDRRRAAARC